MNGPESDNRQVELAQIGRIANLVKLGAEIAEKEKEQALSGFLVGYYTGANQVLNTLYLWLTDQKPPEGIWEEVEKKISKETK